MMPVRSGKTLLLTTMVLSESSAKVVIRSLLRMDLISFVQTTVVQDGSLLLAHSVLRMLRQMTPAISPLILMIPTPFISHPMASALQNQLMAVGPGGTSQLA